MWNTTEIKFYRLEDWNEGCTTRVDDFQDAIKFARHEVDDHIFDILMRWDLNKATDLIHRVLS